MTLSARFSLRAGSFDLTAELQLESGVLILFGPSGAGKSLTLSALAGFITPAEGKIVVGGRTLFDSQTGTHIPAHLRGIGYVPQHHSLFPFLSVAENVAFGLSRSERKGTHKKVQHLLEELQLTELADAKPSSLSGGERQRVAFARALAVEPQLLLLDEPFASLDQRSRDRIRSLLVEVLTRHKIPAVLITHDRQEALALGDQLVRFQRGKTVASGTPEEVLLNDEIILEGTLSTAPSEGNNQVNRLSDVVLHGPTEHLNPDEDGRFRIRLPVSLREE